MIIGHGPICRIPGRCHFQSYISINDNVFLPHLSDQPFKAGYYFLHIWPEHTARVATEQLEDLDVMTLACPTQEGELKIIESVWSIMEVKLSEKGIHKASCH